MEASNSGVDLGTGFAHPHASEEARRIAEQGMILRAQVGSGVHGTAVVGQDDRDNEMGICLEPPEHVTGVARVPAGINETSRRVARSHSWRGQAQSRPTFGSHISRSGC